MKDKFLFKKKNIIISVLFAIVFLSAFVFAFSGILNVHASRTVRTDENGNIFYVYNVDDPELEIENEYVNLNSGEPDEFQTDISRKLSSFDVNDPFLILVNKENPLTEDVECELVKFDGFEIDIRIYEDVLQMFKDAKEEGCNLFLASGYRDYNTQRFLYEKKISYFKKLGYDSKEAEEIASMKVTPPLTSEHETGLAVDILSYAYNNMDAGFGQSEAGIWLSENCYKYGFILRYPEGKEDITEIQYEPWHFRYVGKEAAEFIYVNKLTFEEFYEMVQTDNE